MLLVRDMESSASEKKGYSKQGAVGAKAAAKKPIKVVCISNPMKFKATASEFRTLVQRLTGQDSDTADIMSSYHPSAHVFDEPGDAAASDHDQEEATPPPPPLPPDATSASASASAGGGGGGVSSICPLELLDGAFNNTRFPESFPW